MIDKKKIGERIIEARRAVGLMTAEALADAMRKKSQERDAKSGGLERLSRQTVQHWEKGKVCPPPDKLELLALVFGGEYDEQWIMFGDRRRQQLDDERPLLVYLTKEEAELINDFRHSNAYGKRSIRINAKAVRQDQPVAEADLHLMRRKVDTSST